MVTLETFGTSSVKFSFENNSLYLNNGEITVPLNSLMLVIDDSELATFKKLNGDPFISVSYADLGMDKDELEQWYKNNMVGGGEESGLTPSEVQDMIDASISGYDEDIQDEIGEKEQVIAIALTELKNDKADTSAVTEAIDAAVSGKVDTSDYETYTAATDATLATKADKNEIPSVSGYADSVEYNSTTKYVNFYHGGTGGTVVYSFNAAPFVIDGMVQNVVISGGSLVISFNTDAGKQDISIPLTEIFDPANYYDKTATDAAINAAVSGKVDTSTYEAYTAATNARLTEDEEVSAAGMNALEEELANKLDASAYTPTDLSEYWTSGETQSAITQAVSGKADNATVTAHTANTAIHVSSNEKYNWNNKLDASSFNTYSAATDTLIGTKLNATDFNTYSAATDARLAEDEEVTAAALNALEDELANKQDALIAGDNITISGNVISADGGGKAVSAGTNISVTTGETADTINCTLPIEVYNNKRLYIGNNNSYENNYNYGLAFGENNTIKYNYAFLFGKYHSNHGDYNLIFGERNECQGGYNSAIGYGIITRNGYESAFGRYNITNKANNTYGDSGNTLFSIGNGTSTIATHNAFEIRQNGDIYITLDGQDVKLQDQLGGGSIIIDPTLDSGSTNPVANSAITTAFNNIEDRLGEDEEVTAAALNALNDGINSVNDKFGGLRIVKLSQQEYDALVTKDSSTLYIVV